jgi:phosphinothricin acetyltransferase
MIRHMREEDGEAVLRIFGEGIATRRATFDTKPPTWAEWKSHKLEHSRLVYLEAGRVVGFVALSPVSSRPPYAGVAELSVYVAAAERGRGLGDRLLKALIESSEEHGIWTLQASVFAENEASLALHIKNGFRIVGRRERIAQLEGVWKDTVLLERRSSRFP